MSDNINDGGPAFPMLVRDFDNECGEHGEYFYRMEGGASLRDYFAAKALPGVMQMVSDGMHQPSITDLPIQQVDFLAKSAYEIADAMLRAREQS